MIIDRNIAPYVIADEVPIRSAIKKIDDNQMGVVICINESGILQGILTDGDFRRWLLVEKNPDLDAPVGQIINRNISRARLYDSKDRIKGILNSKVQILPLVDVDDRFVAIARMRESAFIIGSSKVGAGNPTFVIAEIGNNHNGDLNLAKRLVDEAVLSGANCAKFQLRDLSTLYSNSGNASDPSEDLGSQYTLDLLSRFQLSTVDMFNIFDYCYEKNIIPLCTPWDLASVDALERYGIEGYKSASADLTNPELLTRLAATGKPLICSTGMSIESEIREAVSVLKASGAQYSLLHCNSTYPAPFKDINLRYMNTLRQIGDCPIGYSSHDRGINIAVAAVALGANIIEKHFTLDRSMEGNDHRVSLLPHEFSEMVAGIRQTEEALGGVDSRRISQGELMNREALGKSLFINMNLQPGETIEAHMLDVRSPGRGLQPNKKSLIVGKAAKRKLSVGDVLYPSDLGEESSVPRSYLFQRPFGIPVRYHDLNTLARLSNLDILEFHLSYKDLTEDEACFFSEKRDMDFVVHAPELFSGDHVLDLCSLDEKYRQESIKNLRQVIEVALRLKPWFSRSSKPLIVVNVGGFTQDKPLDRRERVGRYEMVLNALEQIDLTEVEIIPQTMPPFPWHFGGQRYQNLFIDPDEIVDFCAKNSYRVCLDTSHSKLACNYYHWSFSEFLRKVGPYTAHIHVGDASGVDGEGLQINEGDIDFQSMGSELKLSAPHASFIPEIWQGHKNGGEGFWRALERLEHIL